MTCHAAGRQACNLSAVKRLIPPGSRTRAGANMIGLIFSIPIILKTGKNLATQTNKLPQSSTLHSAQNAEVRVSWNRFGGPVSNVCQSCRRAVCCKKSQWLKCTKANADTGGWQLWCHDEILLVLASHWYFRFRNRGVAPKSARHHLFPFSQSALHHYFSKPEP